MHPTGYAEATLSGVRDDRDAEVGDDLVAGLEGAPVVGVPVEELVLAEGGGTAGRGLAIGAVAADVGQVGAAKLLWRHDRPELVRDPLVELRVAPGAPSRGGPARIRTPQAP
jgi:hypothetical protein